MKSFFDSTDPTQVSCSSSALSRFTKQLSVMLAAGIPMHSALDSLARVQIDELSIWVTPELSKKIGQGHRLSSCCAQFPRVFPLTYLALIRAAEETGKLVAILDRLGHWLDRKEKVERHVRKALTYPAFVVVTAIVLTITLFRTVIPSILTTVLALKVDLPLPTRILVLLVKILESPMSWALMVLAALCFTLYLRIPQNRDLAQKVLFVLPVIGPIFQTISTARFSHTLALLVDSGVDIIKACKISADASGNPFISQDSSRLVNELREGQMLSDALATSSAYPILLVDLVKVGDETGRMAVMLQRCGDILEDDTLHKVDTLLNLLEPLVLSTISLGVGFIVIAILLPMSVIVSSL